MKVAINSFVRRQTEASPFTHFEGTDEKLIKMVEKALAAGKFNPGYRGGVVLVEVNPMSFYTGIVILKDGDKLVGEFKARIPGEEPRQSIHVKHPYAGPAREKQQARRVEVVLYSHDVLAEDGDAETDAEWEIISINGHPTEELSPIEPFTLMHNHFGSDGGTDTNLTPEQFEEKMRESFIYWKDKGMLV